jgi:glucose repression regulatory protein TUP1
MWDIESGQQVLTLSIEDGVTTVAISPDGQYAAGSLDKSVRVWDSRSGYLVERLDGLRGIEIVFTLSRLHKRQRSR